VNTAFTTTCPEKSEIVVFREEEWFKVFLHETIHNFGVDFSDMDLASIHSQVLSLFKVESEVNLFEAYTECWAEIWNVVFCSYQDAKTKMRTKTKIHDLFLAAFSHFMEMEIKYGLFQMVKVLQFMGLEYKDLYQERESSAVLRNTLYKENSNVLAYYILKNIYLFYWEDFLSWCKKNNQDEKNLPMEFQKSTENVQSFFDLLTKKYKTRAFLEAVDCAYDFSFAMKKAKRSTLSHRFLVENMRMTVSEMG
jgi:hypothetical protein